VTCPCQIGAAGLCQADALIDEAKRAHPRMNRGTPDRLTPTQARQQMQGWSVRRIILADNRTPRTQSWSAQAWKPAIGDCPPLLASSPSTAAQFRTTRQRRSRIGNRSDGQSDPRPVGRLNLDAPRSQARGNDVAAVRECASRASGVECDTQRMRSAVGRCERPARAS